ncbi:unnamed protein product [Amoebophrya sp. A120]|nr:unnamed protein product [Amoebophrya sp. A120]|eukprot:GSA120T00006892001.1
MCLWIFRKPNSVCRRMRGKEVGTQVACHQARISITKGHQGRPHMIPDTGFRDLGHLLFQSSMTNHLPSEIEETTTSIPTFSVTNGSTVSDFWSRRKPEVTFSMWERIGRIFRDFGMEPSL